MNKRRIAIYMLGVAWTLSTICFAATADPPFGPTGGCQEYTPIKGKVFITTTQIHFSDLTWGDYYFSWMDVWEGEIRNVQTMVYSEQETGTRPDVLGTLPSLTAEADENDVSIVCKNMSEIEPGSSYFASAYVTALPSYDTGVNLNFESELGAFYFGDSVPQRYQVCDQLLNTKTQTRIEW